MTSLSDANHRIASKLKIRVSPDRTTFACKLHKTMYVGKVVPSTDGLRVEVTKCKEGNVHEECTPFLISNGAIVWSSTCFDEKYKIVADILVRRHFSRVTLEGT